MRKTVIIQQLENKGTKTMIKDDGPHCSLVSDETRGVMGAAMNLTGLPSPVGRKTRPTVTLAPLPCRPVVVRAAFLRNRIFTFLGKNPSVFTCQL